MSGKSSFTPVANAFRIYNNDTTGGFGTGDTLSTPKEAQNVNHTTVFLADDYGPYRFHLRIRVDETGGSSGLSSDTYTLQRAINGGGYLFFNSATTTYIRSSGSSNSTFGDGTTTNRTVDPVTDPASGSFIGGAKSTNTSTTNPVNALTAGNFTEHLWAIDVLLDSFADNDFVDFRISLNSGSPGMTNNVTPRIIIRKTSIKHPGSPGSPMQSLRLRL